MDRIIKLSRLPNQREMALLNIGHLAYDTCHLSGSTKAGLFTWWIRITAYLLSLLFLFSVIGNQKDGYSYDYTHNPGSYDWTGCGAEKCFPKSGEENEADDQRSQVREKMRFIFVHTLFHHQFAAQHPHLALKAIFTRFLRSEFQGYLPPFRQQCALVEIGEQHLFGTC